MKSAAYFIGLFLFAIGCGASSGDPGLFLLIAGAGILIYCIILAIAKP